VKKPTKTKSTCYHTHRQQPHLRPVVQAIALALAMQVAGANAATITVDSNIDAANNCSLRNAIEAANTDTSIGTCSSGSGDDIIDLSDIAGQTITLAGTQLPTVTSAISIQGAGITVDGDRKSGLFYAKGASADLTIDSMTLTGGFASYGSGIAIRDGTLNLTNSLVSGNLAVAGGGIRVGKATANLSSSTVSGNSAEFGGGINAFGSKVYLTNSTVSVNSAEKDGGGIYASYGTTVNLNNSTVSGNSAPIRGGGVYTVDGKFNLTNSTVSGNSAGFGGNTGSGGGIHTSRGTVNLTNSTVSSNSSGDGAGIVVWFQSTINLTNSTVSGNSAARSGGGVFAREGTVNLTNSIIANSTGTDCEDTYSGSTFTTYGANLIENIGDCTFIGPAPITGVDPILGPLADNGGPTWTHLPLPGSPVIDAGDNVFVPVEVEFDQRGTGFDRVVGTVDLGSVEVQPEQSGPDFVVTAADDGPNDGVCRTAPGHCNLREAVTAANANADASTITFANSLLSPAPATITLAGTQLPTVTSAISIQGAGITVDGDDQSGLFNVSTASANLTIDRMTLTGGSAIKGGGVYSDSGTVNLINSKVSGNTAASNGGGIYSDSGTVNLTNSTVSGNPASYGGGMFAAYGAVYLTNSTVSGNSAALSGGGILTFGGAVYLTSSTISDNSAGDLGGGVFAFGGTVNLTNSIIANSTGTDCENSISTFTTNGANLIESIGDCTFIGPAPITGIDPLLGPLADNGGPTWTHLPMPGSPVIEAGDSSFVPIELEFDQRGIGYDRILGLNVDLGSVEALPPPPVLIFSDSFE
jgi:hypothetical protein